jgi:hypothetical protein
MSPFDERRARRYLLGRLSEEETAALEAEYFTSSDVLERVWEVENDLVDAFVAGELSPDERTAFEAHYLASPLHRDRVETARMLRAATGGTAAPRRRLPAWSLWLPLAAALVLALAWWAWQRPEAPKPTVAQATPAAAATATPAASAEPAPPASTSRPRTSVAAFALSPLLMRGGQPTPVLRVPPGTDELKLTLEGERPQAVAPDTPLPFTISTVEGERVAEGLTLRGPGFGVASIAAGRLGPGDYILTVRSPSARADAPPLCQYFFRVPPH